MGNCRVTDSIQYGDNHLLCNFILFLADEMLSNLIRFYKMMVRAKL